jgi:DNA polymerase-3 subunit alpha
VDDVERFKRDPVLNDRLRVGDTIGCFYIESPAMRQLLRKLECADYRTLVAASSIIRPGVAKSGMMREYIQRHHRPDDFAYLHPKMKELMAETYGVMVYQEDVIKVAHHFAGIDLADADILRRAMSGKYRSRDGFLKIRDTYFRNCAERGYPPDIAAEVWRQMESFSGYSFSKAHSASFAVESYQSLFLKAYYPREFMVAVINNFGGFYSTEFYVNEARRAGASIHAPCVNRGAYQTAIRGEQLFLGLQHVKELERELALAIEAERVRHGPYTNLEDFVRRVPLSLEQLNILVRMGSFRFTGRSKKQTLWDAAMLFGAAAGRAPDHKDELFHVPARHYSLPDLTHTSVEDAYDELELLGFPLCDPFVLLEHPLPAKRKLACELAACSGKTVYVPGYLVCTKDVRAGSGELMKFGTFMDPEGGNFDTVHFPPSLKRFPLVGRGVYGMTGKVTLDFGVPTLEVQHLERLTWIPDPRYAEAPAGRVPVVDATSSKAKRAGRW